MAHSRPNILYVFPDQLGARWLSCHGNPVVRSPNLDRFARESYLFTQAYTSSPICTPYRGCLYTGRYPTQTGITYNGYALPPGETTLAELLNEAGYQTSYVGKWHLSGAPNCNRWVPPEKRGGFQSFIGWESHHVDHWQGRIWEDDPDDPIVMQGHETDGLTSIVCQRLEDMGREPFCMFVSYQAPHPPCTPLEEHLEPYDGQDLFPDLNADRQAWYDKPVWNADYDVGTFRERYFGEITHIDEAFGTILGKLDELGLADNTVVLFTSDHGEMCGCHGLFGKGIMYQEAVQVPLMIRMPGQAAGAVVDHPVCTIDLMPTLLELCGAEPNPLAEGVSFGGILRGGDAAENRPIFIDFAAGPPHPAGRGLVQDHQALCVIEGAWKLVTDRVEGATPKPHALFDLESDPFELTNLVDDAIRAEKVSQLRSKIEEWWASISTRARIA